MSLDDFMLRVMVLDKGWVFLYGTAMYNARLNKLVQLDTLRETLLEIIHLYEES